MKPYVLVLDDDPEQFAIIERILEGFCITDYAQTAIDAFRMAAERTYALFLIDINLADITGTTFSSAIRRGNKYIDTPIIAYSGDWTLDPEALKASGCSDFLRRPFTKAELQAKVMAWLEQVRQPSKPTVS